MPRRWAKNALHYVNSGRYGPGDSVQYLKFDTRSLVQLAAGVDLPGFQVETLLTDDQRQALSADLAAPD